MQALTAESSGLGRIIPLLFWREKSLKTICFDSFIRNELVASAFA